MDISPAVRRRIKWGTGIGILLAAVVVTLLTFADSYAIDEGLRRCALSLGNSKWPMYFGCAMAAHEGLAGGLLGGAGALWAAWLAFQAVQEQLDEERERRRKLQADGKRAAVMCITPLLNAAAATLAAIDNALRATNKY